jgi:hypothetical protein
MAKESNHMAKSMSSKSNHVRLDKQKLAELGLTCEMICQEAACDEGIGFCLACGAERGCCEPDAKNYPCEDCGANMVFGAEQCCLLMF